MTAHPGLFFVVESPFSLRDWDRFGIDELSNRFDVVVVDVSAISKPRLAEVRQGDAMEDPRIIRPTNADALVRAIEERHPRAILANLGVGPIRTELFAVAQRRGVVLAEFNLGVIPDSGLKSASAVTRLRQRVRQLPSLAQLPHAFNERRKKRRLPEVEPDVFFRGGLRASGRQAKAGKIVVDVHSIDYETSLHISKTDIQVNPRQVAYLDQDLAFHTDFPGLGLKHPVSARDFYPSINSFFDWLEGEHGLEVVICPHPRADAPSYSSRFPNRRISTYPTSMEIRQSAAVCGHRSTSFSFAVVFEKPALVLTSNEMSGSWYAPYVETFATELAAPLVNLSDPGSWIAPASTITAAQSNSYSTYRKNYLKSYDGPDRRLWTMIGDDLLRRIKV